MNPSSCRPRAHNRTSTQRRHTAQKATQETRFDEGKPRAHKKHGRHTAQPTEETSFAEDKPRAHKKEVSNGRHTAQPSEETSFDEDKPRAHKKEVSNGRHTAQPSEETSFDEDKPRAHKKHASRGTEYWRLPRHNAHSCQSHCTYAVCTSTARHSAQVQHNNVNPTTRSSNHPEWQDVEGCTALIRWCRAKIHTESCPSGHRHRLPTANQSPINRIQMC